MKNIFRFFLVFILFVSVNLSANAVDLMCQFEEYNIKIPEVKAHDLHIHIKYDDRKNTISYVHFGKVKKVDSIVDYNYKSLTFKINYKYPFGSTDVLYKLDRGTNELTTDRNEILNANRSYIAKYKGYGTCEIIPKRKVPKL